METPETKCFNCGYKISKPTPITGSPSPKPGDLGFCANCGALLIYNGEITPCEPELKEILALKPKCMALVEFIQTMITQRGRIK